MPPPPTSPESTRPTLGRLIRDVFGDGWSATYHKRKTLPLIEHWEWPFWSEAPAPVPVHVLTGERDWMQAAWMLASWFHFTEIAWRVVIHDDGSLSPHAVEVLKRLFHGARIIFRDEADAAMSAQLTRFPFCHDFRRAETVAIKIFDMPHFAAGKRFLMFDSDVLFFQHPREILDWVHTDNESCWFLQDTQERSLISATEAREEFGVKLWSRVSSAIGLIGKPAIDFDFCDRAMAGTAMVGAKDPRIERTLYNLCASRRLEGGLLPQRYEMASSKPLDVSTVARHYPVDTQPRFFSEGLKRLSPILLATEEED